MFITKCIVRQVCLPNLYVSTATQPLYGQVDAGIKAYPALETASVDNKKFFYLFMLVASQPIIGLAFMYKQMIVINAYPQFNSTLCFMYKQIYIIVICQNN